MNPANGLGVSLSKWTTPLLRQPPKWNVTLPYPTPLKSFNPDVFWLMDHATRLIELTNCLNYLLASCPGADDKQGEPMNNSIPVSSLLHDKSPVVWSVPPSATVYDAIKLMADQNIGALPVLAEGRLVGVFTERDYTRKVALCGKSSRETQVGEIIARPVVAVTPEDSVAQCMRLMTEHRVRHLPVLVNTELVGIISIGDLVNWTISSQAAAISQMEQYISGGL